MSSLQTDKVGHHTEEREEIPTRQAHSTPRQRNHPRYTEYATLHLHYTMSKTIPEQLQQFKSTAAKARTLSASFSHALHERDVKELNLFLLANVNTVMCHCIMEREGGKKKKKGERKKATKSPTKHVISATSTLIR